MNFRELASSVDDLVADTFSEDASINGEPVAVIVSDDAFGVDGLAVPIETRQVVLMVRTPIARRLGLAKGMPVDLRGQSHAIREFAHDNYGMTRIELG